MLPVKPLVMMAIAALLLITIVSAQNCTTSEVKDALKASLYEYLTNPAASTLTVAEIKDLLNFYLSINTQQATVDCSAAGTESGSTYEALVTKTETITTTVPTCADGTKYGECSATKPKYCYSGSLLNKCETCGCPSNTVCQAGSCVAPTTTPPPNVTSTNITCSSNANCGTDGYAGNYFCDGGHVRRNFVNYTCLNPGTSSSSCSSTSTTILIDACSTMNETCVSGQSTCQANGTTSTNITCKSDLDCGPTGYVSSYYCKDGDVVQDYRTAACLKPGTISSSCSGNTTVAIIDDCTSNEYCVAGQSSCQSNATAPVTCSETDAGNLGKSYYVRGTCSYSNGTSFQDYCQGSVIKEYTCGSYTGPQGSYQSCALWTGGSYTCPEGCSNGACITTLKNCGNGVCDIDETSANCPADCTLPTTGCTDTDNGQNVYIKGSATGENVGGVVQTDTCTTHYWVDRPYTFGVAEWYCSSATAVAQVALDCPSGYACDDGACKIMSCTPGTKCIDGNTKGYQDSSCIWSSISDCESTYSCVNGACVSTCFDSDKDIVNPSFTKGYCADQTGNYTDYCGSATQARDYYCGGTWTGGQWVNVSCKAGGYGCTNGCANGACIP